MLTQIVCYIEYFYKYFYLESNRFFSNMIEKTVFEHSSQLKQNYDNSCKVLSHKIPMFW